MDQPASAGEKKSASSINCTLRSVEMADVFIMFMV
jgi:hypothetical protein